MGKAICIIGMHRSGTSLFTRLLNHSGVYLGEGSKIKFLGSSWANPHGHWELRPVMNINGALLGKNNSSWNRIKFGVDWYDKKKFQVEENRIKKLFVVFKDKPVWGWKDPRTCVLFPIWESVLEYMNVEIKPVMCLRNPLSVANSLKKRNSFPLEKSFNLWYVHNSYAKEYLKKYKYPVVQYDSIIDTPIKTMKSCINALGIPFEKPMVDKWKTEIDPELRRSGKISEEELKSKAPKEVAELYEELNGNCV